MKLCYIVYREDNVMVFNSQVLEYLEQMKKKNCFESIELIVFRHQKNLRKKDAVESKIKKYVENYKTFATFLPPLSMMQLSLSASKLKRYIKSKYGKEDKIAVIARGDFATVVASKAFKNFSNSRLLFDNRGLPVEESEMAHPTGLLHKINRKIKYKSIMYAKDHCDLYNFVTNSLRDHCIGKYGYAADKPYSIIPTLYRPSEPDPELLNEIKERESIKENQYVVTYIGSTAAWQSSALLSEIVKTINEKIENVKFLILTNGSMAELSEYRDKTSADIVIKSVPHKEISHYLRLSDLGIVIRDNNIVNKVAAPTKIAEYLTSGLKILYSGKIGVFEDVKPLLNDRQLICFDNEQWLSIVEENVGKHTKNTVSPDVLKYFDVDMRQQDTIDLFSTSFSGT